MSVTRHPATSQVPLARLALLAGEAFGHQSSHDGVLADSTYSRQIRSALGLAVVVCLLIAVYLAV